MLLHTCCADCLVKTLVNLEKEGHSKDEILVYFDNSNIHPRSEWLARLDAVKKVAAEGRLELIVADWSPKKWFEAIEYDSDNEDMRRCKKCWKFRLGRAVEKCRELGVKRFSMTLLASRYQDREEIVRIGKKGPGKLEFVDVNVDQENDSPGGFYMQNYCGCAYSLVERLEEKFRN